MTAERWEQVKRLYDSALQREAEQRAAYLDQACAGDLALRREVESLLAYEKRAENFIQTPALEVAAKTLAKEPTPSLIGRQISHYQIISRLGAGGMGEVYLAEDCRLGRKVALKLLPLRFTQEAERVRRFEREARAASALNHPNIVTIHEIGRVDDLHYIVTEYIEGQTLRQLLSTPLKPSAALEVAVQVASALAAAHEVGVVHRDIKPENLMQRPDGYIKVLDFGLAKLTEPQTPAADDEAATVAESATEAGVVMGTVGYMSPEQVRGQKIDARTDIFSLGVVLYEMLAGQGPFVGATSADVLAAVLQTEPLPLVRHSRTVPEALGWIVTKTLRKDRAERYQTISDLLVDLKRLKQELELEVSLQRSGQPATNREAASGRAGGQASGYETIRAKPPLQRRASRKAIDSLAILPLRNTSADPNTEYLSDGITESIIAAVSGLPKLRVMAWSTVSRYKHATSAPQEVGQELGVRAVLTGRIVQSSDRLVIKTELVDTRDGSRLWGEQYNFKPADLFTIEEEIAKEISEKLLLRLTGAEKRQLAKRATDNTEAYHAYLRGRYYWNKRTDEEVRKAIEYFKQAIDRDPCYALAYAGLADSYVILGSFGVATLPPGEAYPKAKEAATKALEIDETLAEAHTSLAFSLAVYDWDWPAAEREFKRALELKPGDAIAHHWYGLIYLVARGTLDEAIASVKRAHELDPLSLTISSNIGLLLYMARRYDQSIEQYRQALEMDRHFVYTHWELALTYEQKALYEEAIAEFQRAIALSGSSLLPLAQLGHAYAVAGKREQALAVLDELTKRTRQHYVSPYRTAAIYAGLGQIEHAFEWLERAYHERDPWLVWLRFDPVMDELRADRRFTSLLERIGLTSDVAPASQPALGVARSTRPASSKRRARKAINSLAILPLVNSSHDPNMEYLSEGITESIINNLSQLPKLKVMARSTVYRYKGQAIVPQQVGRELDVRAVLAGGVLQLGDNLVISTELINVADGAQLWGEQYKRKLSDIFAVQEEIAQEITEKLRLKLTGEEKRRLVRRYTQNTAAYQAYLKGRYYWNKRDVAGLKKGVEHFRQAIDLDPSYASAYSGLSDCYTLLVVREARAPEDGFAKAKAAAALALQIDEAFAEAHASLGHALLHNWEWDEAERELKRAIELNPGYPSAHHWYSEHLTALGRCEESIAELKLAGELDPLSLVISADLGRAFYYARAYDQVLEQEAGTLELEPNFWLSHINLGRAYTQKGQHAQALNHLQKARELSVGNTEVLSFLGFAYAAAAKRDEALETLRELDEQAQRGHVPPYHYAIVHAGLGEKDRAFEWLERAFAKRAVDLFTLKVEPMFDSLRADQRFTDLLQRVGLAPPLLEEKPVSARQAAELKPATGQAKLAAIAVLPFRPLSAEGRDEYLELGLADALITRLSDIQQIVVRPTSTVRKYTALEQDSVGAGRELAVESVLEGSLQKLGDRLRVTARLVRVADGRSLWTGKFDEKFTDIFAVEDSISEQVAAALALKLSGAEKERLTKRYTENIAAYHLYLKGRYHWNKRSEEALHKALECFKQAIEIDPNYALAYAGLADAYTYLGDVGITAISPKEAFAKGRAAAAKALDIDETLAEAHTSLGHLSMHHFQWSEAGKQFRRALELKPNYATAHQLYAYYLIFTGRTDEALTEIAQALELDPLSVPINADVGELRYFARQSEQALEQLHKMLELDPRYYRARLYLARVYEQKQMYAEAIAELQKAVELSEQNTDALASLAHGYAVAGQRTEALDLLARLNELAQRKHLPPYDVALIHAGLGEAERAFAWLDKAYEERAEWMIYLAVDPRLDGLRTDPKFTDLLRRVGLAP